MLADALLPCARRHAALPEAHGAQASPDGTVVRTGERQGRDAVHVAIEDDEREVGVAEHVPRRHDEVRAARDRLRRVEGVADEHED